MPVAKSKSFTLQTNLLSPLRQRKKSAEQFG